MNIENILLTPKDIPQFNEHELKKLYSHQWTLYKINPKEYFLVTNGGCPCCHGNLKKKYLITDLSGKIIRESNFEEFSKIEVIGLVRVEIPKHLKPTPVFNFRI